MSTPFMGLTLPTPTVTPGPLYAFENNQAFLQIDGHDHSPGNGAPILTAAISINADLPFNSFNATLLRSTRYADQVSPLALPADVTCLYTVGGNLYYNNGIGQAIQLTIGAALNATSIGGIGGDYATSTASEFYTSLDSTFTFWSAANTPAIIDSGPVIIRNVLANSFGIIINPPSVLSADYNLFLPTALPPSTKIMTLDASGNIAAVYDTDNITLEVASNTLRVKAQGITTTQIANNTILNGNIANTTITVAKALGPWDITGTKTTFTSNGTWTAPAQVNFVRVVGCGGGGGGGGGQTGVFSGGGGAGAAIFDGFIPVTPGNTYNIVVGTGGAGGTNNVNGGNGTTSSFDTFNFPGGDAGVRGQDGGGGGTGYRMFGESTSGASGGAGGASGPYLNTAPTSNGGNGFGDPGGGGGGGGSIGAGGAGGTRSGSPISGTAGSNYGAGGGGGSSNPAGNISGGNGAPGIVIVYVV